MALPPGFVPTFGENEARIESPPWLPAGWHAVERPRETGGHADRFYYTPDCGVRLRSKPCAPLQRLARAATPCAFHASTLVAPRALSTLRLTWRC